MYILYFISVFYKKMYLSVTERNYTIEYTHTLIYLHWRCLYLKNFTKRQVKTRHTVKIIIFNVYNILKVFLCRNSLRSVFEFTSTIKCTKLFFTFSIQHRHHSKRLSHTMCIQNIYIYDFQSFLLISFFFCFRKLLFTISPTILTKTSCIFLYFASDCIYLLVICFLIVRQYYH